MTRDLSIGRAATAALLACVLSATACGAGGRQVERSAAKRLVGSGTAKAVESGAILRDSVRDLFTGVRRIEKPRTVFRYMSAEEARLVRTRGIPAGKHFTATAGPGRPMSDTRAAERYGLPVVPSHRITVKLPTGTPVKSNKVLGGARGVGELKVMTPVGGRQTRVPVSLPRKPGRAHGRD